MGGIQGRYFGGAKERKWRGKVMQFYFSQNLSFKDYKYRHTSGTMLVSSIKLPLNSINHISLEEVNLGHTCMLRMEQEPSDA